MKLLAIICLIFIFSVAVKCQKKSKKTEKCSFSNEELFGKVEAVEQHCYKAVEKGGKLLKGSRSNERYPSSSFIESYGNAVGQFDVMNRIVNLRFYDENGRLSRQDLHQYNPNEPANYFLESNPKDKVAIRIKHE